MRYSKILSFSDLKSLLAQLWLYGPLRILACLSINLSPMQSVSESTLLDIQYILVSIVQPSIARQFSSSNFSGCLSITFFRILDASVVIISHPSQLYLFLMNYLAKILLLLAPISFFCLHRTKDFPEEVINLRHDIDTFS